MEQEKMTYSEAMAYVEEEIAHKEAQAEALYDASYQ
jgi:flagellar hook-associated protein FlgK